ncbi:hypothetical protein FRC08_014173 [Ceratobasidium sp. 394]|nr:hypothetical protein FRC08_014173 [Ceratobasidium sp. 394]
MKFLAILSLIASVSAAAIDARSGVRISQAAAQALLESVGIYASSSGHCTNKNNPKCTSYEGIFSETVWGVIGLKYDSKCPITITGGTEAGHAPGPHSHANGYKVNLRKNTCLNSYIRKHFKKSGSCWNDASGNVYCDIGVAWDV